MQHTFIEVPLDQLHGSDDELSFQPGCSGVIDVFDDYGSGLSQKALCFFYSEGAFWLHELMREGKRKGMVAADGLVNKQAGNRCYSFAIDKDLTARK